jgi:HEAT repeat protein
MDEPVIAYVKRYLAERAKRMKEDPRSIEELISVVLNESDDDVAGDAVSVLHFRGTSDVLDRATKLCRSDLAAERRLGAVILGQLGVPERAFPRECLSILLEMLNCEEDIDVLQAICIALGHLGQPEAVEAALRFRIHPDPSVRFGVIMALTGHEDGRAIEGLIELSKDEDAHNRDWATFALGSQIDLDTPAIREALLQRLNDEDFDTRCEAIAGLAQRADRRVIPALARELTSDCVGTLAVEAAATIAAPELLPHLVALKDWWDVNPALVTEAIQACSSTNKHE